MAARVLSVLAVGSLALAMAPALAQDPGPAPDADEAANPARLVTFYPHVFALTAAQPMPGNTQYPWGEDDFSAGYPDWGCYPEPGKPVYDALPGVPGIPFYSNPTRITTCREWDQNLLYVYSTAGFVHADQDTWTYEDFHNERGQAKDILLDTTQDITATFYMSADWHGWYGCGQNPVAGIPWPSPCWNWDPGFYPGWRVEATLYLGSMGEYQGQASEAPPVHEKFLSGELEVLAQGLSEPVDMLSLDASFNGGQGEVYEFPINLGKPQLPAIAKELDWIMQFRWFMDNADQQMLLDLNWNVNSGEFYPIRFEMPVKNPFDVELVFPQFLHDKLLLHAMLNSPWGSYDVDSRTVQLEALRDGQPLEPRHMTRSADFSVAHGGHYKPVNITWVWDHKADALPPGDYTVRVTASNFQHSAESTTEAAFRLRPDGTGEVLRIGRAGQQTSTEAQLASLGGP